VTQPSSNFINFWNAIIQQQIVKEDKKWSLGGDVSWIGGTNVMYVRDCYVQLADQLLGETVPAKPELNCALILGPKGIGKTMFLNYLIVRIVEKARSSNELESLTIVYYFMRDQSTSRIRFTAGGCTIIPSAEIADYYLSDSLDIADGTLGERLLLEVASENQHNYKKFSDRLTEKNGERLFMDVWTLDELKQVKHPEWTDVEVAFLRAVFGGRVRNVLGGSFNAAEVKDDIDDTAVWLFGTDVKKKFAKSVNTKGGAKGRT
jgi:hypothetical protein